MRETGIPNTKKVTPATIAVICHPYSLIAKKMSKENTDAKVEHADTIANARTRLRTNHLPSVPTKTTLVIAKMLILINHNAVCICNSFWTWVIRRNTDPVTKIPISMTGLGPCRSITKPTTGAITTPEIKLTNSDPKDMYA